MVTSTLLDIYIYIYIYKAGGLFFKHVVVLLHMYNITWAKIQYLLSTHCNNIAWREREKQSYLPPSCLVPNIQIYILPVCQGTEWFIRINFSYFLVPTKEGWGEKGVLYQARPPTRFLMKCGLIRSVKPDNT